MSDDNLSLFLEDLHVLDRLMSVLSSHLDKFLNQEGYNVEVEESYVLSVVIQEILRRVILKVF